MQRNDRNLWHCCPRQEPNSARGHWLKPNVRSISRTCSPPRRAGLGVQSQQYDSQIEGEKLNKNGAAVNVRKPAPPENLIELDGNSNWIELSKTEGATFKNSLARPSAPGTQLSQRNWIELTEIALGIILNSPKIEGANFWNYLARPSMSWTQLSWRNWMKLKLNWFKTRRPQP